MSNYFRNLSGDSSGSFEFAEDLGHATDRAQGVLNLIAEQIAKDSDNTLFFATHSALRELADMRESINSFLDSHPELATNDLNKEGAK